MEAFNNQFMDVFLCKILYIFKTWEASLLSTLLLNHLNEEPLSGKMVFDSLVFSQSGLIPFYTTLNECFIFPTFQVKRGEYSYDIYAYFWSELCPGIFSSGSRLLNPICVGLILLCKWHTRNVR